MRWHPKSTNHVEPSPSENQNQYNKIKNNFNFKNQSHAKTYNPIEWTDVSVFKERSKTNEVKHKSDINECSFILPIWNIKNQKVKIAPKNLPEQSGLNKNPEVENNIKMQTKVIDLANTNL